MTLRINGKKYRVNERGQAIIIGLQGILGAALLIAWVYGIIFFCIWAGRGFVW